MENTRTNPRGMNMFVIFVGSFSESRCLLGAIGVVQSTMEKIFEGVYALLLTDGGMVSKGMTTSAHALSRGGGRWDRHISVNTTHIIATDWEAVAAYFHLKDGVLLWHWKRNHIVTWEWVTASKASGEQVDVHRFKIPPGDPVGRRVPNWSEADIVEQRNALVMMKTTAEDLVEIERRGKRRIQEHKEQCRRATALRRKQWHDWRSKLSAPYMKEKYNDSISDEEEKLLEDLLVDGHPALSNDFPLDD